MDQRNLGYRLVQRLELALADLHEDTVYAFLE
jgi:hypothetical protein